MKSLQVRRLFVSVMIILFVSSSFGALPLRANATSSQSTIAFSGYSWNVKDSYGSRSNPGLNYWSSSTNNVWVDGNGWLHLKITYMNGKWYCAEVSTVNSLGYGTYVFYTASRIDNLDKNVVVGLFSYVDDNHEVDIEFSRWGDANAHNAWYTVQPRPYDITNQKSFDISLNGYYSTHWFTWSPNQVFFESFHGHYPYNAPPAANIIQSWPCSLSRQADEAKAHINLWLVNTTSLGDSAF